MKESAPPHIYLKMNPKKNYSITSKVFIERIRCKCCKEVKYLPSLFICYNILRNFVEGKCYITSGYRCEKYNTIIGGSKNSYHKKGMALDIHFSTPLEIHQFTLAKNSGFKGCIIYLEKNFTHFDLREKKYFALKAL